MELQFKGIVEQVDEEEILPENISDRYILPAWAYTIDEIKTMIEQYLEHTKTIEWIHSEEE